MLGKLLIPIISSWLLTPTLALLAHLMGLGSDSTLAAVIFVFGAAVPFLLLYNEVVALADFKTSASRVHWLIPLLIFIVQVISVGFMSSAAEELRVSRFLLWVATLLCGLGNLISFQATRIYYYRLGADLLSHRQALIFGVSSGLTQAFLYAAAFLLNYFNWTEARSTVLLLILILPALVQRLTLNQEIKALAANRLSPVIAAGLVILALLLAALSFKASGVRAAIATKHGQYLVLLLVALNLTFTVCLAAGKLMHLRRVPEAHFFGIYFAVAGSCLVFASQLDSLFGALLKLVGFQFAIFSAITLGRTRLSRHLTLISSGESQPAREK